MACPRQSSLTPPAQQAIALHDKMKEIWSGAKDSIKLSQRRAQVYQNQRRKDPEISTDKLRRNRPTPKLNFKWTGPYPVKSVYEGAATLDLPRFTRLSTSPGCASTLMIPCQASRPM